MFLDDSIWTCVVATWERLEGENSKNSKKLRKNSKK
jgi:hypothetical protein